MPKTPAVLHKLRPAKIRRAAGRRIFEAILHRTPVTAAGAPEDVGTPYGGYILPVGLIDPGWTCYSVGAGGDISFDLELARRFDARVRCFDPVADYVARAEAAAADEPRVTAFEAAIAVADGPLRLQRTHDPTSQSVSSASLYETAGTFEVEGRSLTSLMQQFGDERIDLLKLDIEGGEYELMPHLDLEGLGVRIFAVQLHHNGGVRGAKHLIADLADRGYRPVGVRPAVKMTFAHDGAVRA